MKYVVLSFDDGRLDTFEYAVPHIVKNSLTATVNIATDFIERPERYVNFSSAMNEAMTIQMIKKTSLAGIEIAGHGHQHINDKNDVLTGLARLKQWKIDGDLYGFASPFSEITLNNHSEIRSMITDGEVAYIRSGIQVRRESILYKMTYLVMEVFHSKRLFYMLNKKNVEVNKKNSLFFTGVSVNCNTTLLQIEYLINKMPDNSQLVLILHSVLPKSHPGYGKDKWYIDESMFEKLCISLKKNNNIQVTTNKLLAERNKTCI